MIGDLNSRRGRIDSMDDLMGGTKLIRGFVPLANMFGYTSDLRSMSKGRAASTMELAQYEEFHLTLHKKLSKSETLNNNFENLKTTSFERWFFVLQKNR